MSNPIIITLTSVFYLSLLLGAITRFVRYRSIATVLQLLGTVLPLIPAALILATGYSNALFYAYGLLWLLMGAGYVMEAFSKPNAA